MESGFASSFIPRSFLSFKVAIDAVQQQFLTEFLGTNVQEDNLMNMLFGRDSQYNPLITPIANPNEPLDVYFGLTLMQIINVYEKEQIVKVNVWLQLRWYDYQMKWNPDRFGRIDAERKESPSTCLSPWFRSIGKYSCHAW